VSPAARSKDLGTAVPKSRLGPGSDSLADSKGCNPGLIEPLRYLRLDVQLDSRLRNAGRCRSEQTFRLSDLLGGDSESPERLDGPRKAIS